LAKLEPRSAMMLRLISDSGSRVKRWRPGMLPKRIQPGTLGQKIKKSQQQASNKLDSSSGMM